MPVRRDNRGRWLFRHVVEVPNAQSGNTLKKRIYGTAPRENNTKAAAEKALQDAIRRLLAPQTRTSNASTSKRRKEVPSFRQFANGRFLEYTEARNKPSEVLSKRSILNRHLIPFFGSMRLDEIRPIDIEDYKLEKLKNGRVVRKKATGDDKRDQGLSKKTIDNHLILLRRILNVAREWELIKRTPRHELYRPKDPAFDFLDFAEADEIIAAAQSLPPHFSRSSFSVGDGDWGRMILFAIRTGLRVGEILALRWDNVDLIAGKIHVCESVTRDTLGTPKSGRARDVPLSQQALKSLRKQRHLRGEQVFCDLDGKRLIRDQCVGPLAQACRRAHLRNITWHQLRHTFASHLVMRGVPLRSVQELLGHQSIEMTMRYAHLAPAAQRAAVQVLDNPAPDFETGEGAPGAWQQNGSK